MTQIVQIQRKNPDPNGSGGHHRIYQVQEDIIKGFGPRSFAGLHIETNPPSKNEDESISIHVLSKRINRIRRLAFRFKAELNSSLNYLTKLSIHNNNPFGSSYLECYLDFLNEYGKPKVCVLDHPSHLNIARYNVDNGIINVYCSHNIETFTYAMHNVHKEWARIQNGLLWSVELEMFSLCQERFMISKSELCLLNGLGLPSTYYPYLPTNEIKTRSEKIRNLRQPAMINKKLFIMLGSCFWPPTKEGFVWVLENIKRFGLPEGAELIVGGKDGSFLEKELGSIDGVEFRDRLEQSEFDYLMQKAVAMLVPNQTGFGALTRLSEMSCAGLPVITTKHSVEGVSPPPGVLVVDTKWDLWSEAMKDLMDSPSEDNHSDYDLWEELQPNPIKNTLQKYLS